MRRETKGDTFVRIDGLVAHEHVQEFLQGIRDLERRHPNEITLSIVVRDDDATVDQMKALVEGITPEFPYQHSVKREDLTEDQQGALDRVLGTLRAATERR